MLKAINTPKALALTYKPGDATISKTCKPCESNKWLLELAIPFMRTRQRTENLDSNRFSNSSAPSVIIHCSTKRLSTKEWMRKCGVHTTPHWSCNCAWLLRSCSPTCSTHCHSETLGRLGVSNIWMSWGFLETVAGKSGCTHTHACTHILFHFTFWDRVLLSILTLNSRSPILLPQLPERWECKHTPPGPAF